MDDLLEANKILLENMKKLTEKVKQLREENKQLKSNSNLFLSETQKKEIDNLLLETKKVLEEFD